MNVGYIAGRLCLSTGNRVKRLVQFLYGICQPRQKQKNFKEYCGCHGQFSKNIEIFIRFHSGNHFGLVHVSQLFGKYYFTQLLFSSAGINTSAWISFRISLCGHCKMAFIIFAIFFMWIHYSRCWLVCLPSTGEVTLVNDAYSDIMQTPCCTLLFFKSFNILTQFPLWWQAGGYWRYKLICHCVTIISVVVSIFPDI